GVMAVAIALHLLAAVYWVGGMLVMLLAVRPAAVELLDPPLRLPLLCGALSRFFRGVWLSLVVLLVTGLWMLFVAFGGFAHSGWHIHGMFLLYLIMASLFIYLFLAPYAVLKRALKDKQFPEAGAQMGRIRNIVRLNASLGVATIIIAGAGRYLTF
ncbi:MAG: CopD family protein, partial [Halopseudomonas sp.]